MSKRILLLIGVILTLSGLLITVMFDVQSFITSTVTFLGMGIMFFALSRSFPRRNMEKNSDENAIDS